MCNCLKFIRGLSLFLQVGVAAAVIAITAIKLTDYNFNASIENVNFGTSCLLGSNSRGFSYCTMTFIVGGVSIGATMALGILMCLTCSLCGLGPIVDVVFAAAGCAWWAVNSVYLYQHQLDLNSLGVPQESMRMLVTYLYWAAAGLFAITFLACAGIVLSACCSCCCSGSGSSRRKGDIESGKGQPYNQQMIRA